MEHTLVSYWKLIHNADVSITQAGCIKRAGTTILLNSTVLPARFYVVK